MEDGSFVSQLTQTRNEGNHSWQTADLLFYQWCAWAARADVRWIVLALSGVFVGWDTFLTAVARIVDFLRSADSVSIIATKGFAAIFAGRRVSAVNRPIYSSRVGISWAGSILVFLNLVLVSLP